MAEEIDWVKKLEEDLERRKNRGKKLSLRDINAYKLADKLSDYIWDIVSKWKYFEKKTVGDKLVRAIDPIGANIAESYGRYFYQDSVVFLYYARGSLYESKFWIEKSYKRKLMDKKQLSEINEHLNKLPLEINTLIKIKKRAAKGLH